MPALALAAGSLCAEDKPAQKIQSAHCVMVVDFQTNGISQKDEVEVWAKGGNSRTETPRVGGKMIMIQLGDTGYSYQQGSRQGSIVALNGNTTERQNFLHYIEWLKQKGRKVGVETVEGITCDKYEHSESNEKEIVWVSQDNQFPVKMIIQMPPNAFETLLFKNVEINPNLPDNLFDLPPDVLFK